MSSHKIQNSFSKAAPIYDDLAGLHRTIADELLSRLNPGAYSTILDIGCGTGYVANQLSQRFPHAQVIALDVAEGMINKTHQVYPQLHCLLSDAVQLPLKKNSVDLLVSNLAYQWIQPLDLAIGQLKQVLKSDGKIACALFGEATCEELMSTLGAVGLVPLQRLPHVSAVTNAFKQAGFDHIKVTSERVYIQLNTIFELLSWLKSIGANQLPMKGFLGRQKLFVMSEYYRKAFALNDGIRVTFEVIWVNST